MLGILAFGHSFPVSDWRGLFGKASANTIAGLFIGQLYMLTGVLLVIAHLAQIYEGEAQDWLTYPIMFGGFGSFAWGRNQYADARQMLHYYATR